jgi:peptidoglycan/LPS O-acetylase OafA/YrhL
MYIFHFIFLDIVAYFFRKSIFLYIKIPEFQVITLFFAVAFVTYLLSRFSYEHIEKYGINFGKRFLRKTVI